MHNEGDSGQTTRFVLSKRGRAFLKARGVDASAYERGEQMLYNEDGSGPARQSPLLLHSAEMDRQLDELVTQSGRDKAAERSERLNRLNRAESVGSADRARERRFRVYIAVMVMGAVVGLASTIYWQLVAH
jgi:hypothetical protein